VSRASSLIYNQDFGTPSLLQIQGSERGMSSLWLTASSGILWQSGAAETNSIPVDIIERIEIIKGPASSSWGSALGGVVNIITKDAGNTSRLQLSKRFVWGKRNPGL